MTNHQAFWAIIAVLIIGGAIAGASKGFLDRPGNTISINNYRECVAAGYPILESYPPQCKTPDGRTFTEEVGNKVEKQGLIQVDEPYPNQIITIPITIHGKARGYWYFEASFPIELVDANGTQLAQSFVQANGEWMTEDFVPFEKTLSFNKPTTPTGTLILHKDNPSGLPEHDDELRIPVAFSAEGGIATCVRAGCSGQLCVPHGEAGNIVTTCEYRQEYACYDSAKCERQPNSQCGWTMTNALTQCLQANK